MRFAFKWHMSVTTVILWDLLEKDVYQRINAIERNSARELRLRDSVMYGIYVHLQSSMIVFENSPSETYLKILRKILMMESFLVKLKTLKNLQKSSEPWQTPKMKLFTKIVNSFQLITIFAKSTIIDVWQYSEYSSVFRTVEHLQNI